MSAPISVIYSMHQEPSERLSVEQSGGSVYACSGSFAMFMTGDQAADLAAKLIAHLEAVQYVPHQYEDCSYCLVSYPFPVSLHHTAEECHVPPVAETAIRLHASSDPFDAAAIRGKS